MRDTKLERQNHDATAKHQSAIKRSLRDLHRGKEREEREKERAKREIDRLNGVVSSSSSSSARPAGAAAGGRPLSETERKRQAEELASLGVNIPDQFRGDLAMAGEWTVTSTTIVPERNNAAGEENPDAVARGVHKRERTEEEIEEEEAVKGLFKKPRRWGRDSRAVAGGDSEDLDALLSGGLVVVKKQEDEEEGQNKPMKEENEEKKVVKEAQETVKTEPEAHVKDEGQDSPPIKKEPLNYDAPIPDEVPSVEDDKSDAPPPIKTEDEGTEGASGGAAPAVIFKKRKPKNIRQK